MGQREWSSSALMVCGICGFFWLVLAMGTCTYLVFWMGHSGWWFALAILLASGWSCKSLRSPEQIAADKAEEAA